MKKNGCRQNCLDKSLNVKKIYILLHIFWFLWKHFNLQICVSKTFTFSSWKKKIWNWLKNFEEFVHCYIYNNTANNIQNFKKNKAFSELCWASRNCKYHSVRKPPFLHFSIHVSNSEVITFLNFIIFVSLASGQPWFIYRFFHLAIWIGKITGSEHAQIALGKTSLSVFFIQVSFISFFSLAGRGIFRTISNM